MLANSCSMRDCVVEVGNIDANTIPAAVVKIGNTDPTFIVVMTSRLACSTWRMIGPLALQTDSDIVSSTRLRSLTCRAIAFDKSSDPLVAAAPISKAKGPNQYLWLSRSC